jgi:4'-phosphopantetheinyl transferase EntD
MSSPDRSIEAEAVRAAMVYLFDDDVAVELAWIESWDESTLHPEERELVARAVEKRRREFAGGRACARAALIRAGGPGVAIGRGPSREPRWPDGFIGSISHARDLSGAAVAKASTYLGIGLDIEEHRHMAEGVVALICREEERRFFAGVPWLDAEHGPRLVFGAKETVHKGTFPVNRVMLGFSEVILTFSPVTPVGVELARGTFAAEPAPGARPDADACRHLEGRFVVTPSHVLCSSFWRAPKAEPPTA